MSRADRRALVAKHAQYFRLIPIFENKDHKVVEGMDTYVLHTKPEDTVFLLVPDVVSYDLAKQQGEKISQMTKRDVIVLSNNVKAMKMEPLSRGEVARMLRLAETGPEAPKPAGG